MMEMEQFNPIKNYECLYEISVLGNVRKILKSKKIIKGN